MNLTSIAGLLVLATLALSACGKSTTTDTPAAADAATSAQDVTSAPDVTSGSDTSDVADPGVKNGITIGDPNARGCEILLTEGTARIESVTFDATVVGTFIREAPKVAISVVAAKDAPLAAGAIQLVVKGDVAQIKVKKVSCVDGKAATLTSTAISLK